MRLRHDRVTRPRGCHSCAEDGLQSVYARSHLEQLIRDAEVDDRVERVRWLICFKWPAYPAVLSVKYHHILKHVDAQRDASVNGFEEAVEAAVGDEPADSLRGVEAQ